MQTVTNRCDVTFGHTFEITWEDCYKCGIPFGLPSAFRKNRLRDHKEWFCPNGHGQVFVGKTEEQRLKERLERETRRANNYRDSAQHYARSAASYQGHATRLRKQVAAGKCPVCNKELKQLKAHMDRQHPTYAEDER